MAKANRALASAQILLRSDDVDGACNRALNKVEDLRLIADYKGDPVSIQNAEWALEQSTNFVAAIQVLISEWHASPV